MIKTDDSKRESLSSRIKNTMSFLCRFPIVTIITLLAIMTFCLLTRWDVIPSYLFINYYNKTLNGELWRPFVSWLPHLDLEHIVMDTFYLIIIGSIVELKYGALNFLAIFFGGNILGAWLSVFFDSVFPGTMGSSSGSHGLVLYLCIIEIALRQHKLITIIFYWGTIFYLIYLTLCGIILGYMGWPFVFFLNGGYDHLGGITFAMIFGSIEILLLKRKRDFIKNA